jgi:hypothetical protein
VAFWTWCWGPVGLALAIPMTVVIAVLARHVPQLEALKVLLVDEPALAPFVVYYQRLLAGDAEEAAEIVEEHGHKVDRLTLYDDLFVPALALAERDRRREELTLDQQQFLWRATRELIVEQQGDDKDGPDETPATNSSRDVPQLMVLGVAVRDEADEIALSCLEHVLPEHCQLRHAQSQFLAGEVIEALAEQPADVVLLSALGPDGGAAVRYLCKRIRQRFPTVDVVVGRWGYTGDRERMTQALRRRGATHVATTLAEAVDLLRRAQPGLVKA